jgi:hypothetical protein
MTHSQIVKAKNTVRSGNINNNEKMRQESEDALVLKVPQFKICSNKVQDEETK